MSRSPLNPISPPSRLALVSSLFVAGCESHLTGTRLDLTPFGGIFAAIGTAVGILYWIIAITAIWLAFVKPATRKGKTIATLCTLVVFGYLPVKAGLQGYMNRLNLEKISTRFVDACEKDSGETAPPRPFHVNRLYIFDASQNVGSIAGPLFERYDGWLNIYKPKDVSVIGDLSAIVPGPDVYLLRRAIIEQTTIGNFTYRGVRQEVIDTMTHAVRASRTNYYLGNEFARGHSCLDENWSRGFSQFVDRSVGFSPGFPRSDTWVRRIPSLFVRGELRSQNTGSESDFNSPIYPEGAVYDYNQRQIVIDGVEHYLRQYFNQNPLSIVGVQAFSRRMLIAYDTGTMAPSVLFQIRDKRSGQLLQEVYVKIPSALRKNADGTMHGHPWHLVKNSVTFIDRRIRFEVVQDETKRSKKYVRYVVEASWNTEDIERVDLPDHLDDGHYGKFSLPKEDIGSSNNLNVIGQWVSEPSGAIWEFKSDNTIMLDGSKWIWQIADGVLSAEYDHPNTDRAIFQASKDGNVLEVTLSNRVGSYEPFLIRRTQSEY